MNFLRQYVRDTWEQWNAFWFAPQDPATLCLIRVLAGSMLLYTHCLWSFGLSDFFHPTAGWTGDLLPATHGDWLRETAIAAGVDPSLAPPSRFSFSIFDYLTTDWLRWSFHVGALLVFVCLMLGLFTRTVSVLAFLAAVSYATRVSPGGFFGLDKINCLLAFYLAIGPSGVRYSLDRLWRERRGIATPDAPLISANLATRLIQVHLCIVYLYGGLGKVQGYTWWDGSAVWWSIASYEYRSLDMTWLARTIDLGLFEFDLLYLTQFLTHATVFLELFYCCLVWNRRLRPWVVFAAIGMHLFIALAMGMMTFGLVMIYANLAFFSPGLIRRFCDPVAGRITLALAGTSNRAD